MSFARPGRHRQRSTYEAAGHWGDANPFGVPLFIVTHRPDEQPDSGEFNFAGSLEEAVERASAAADGKRVHGPGDVRPAG